MIPKLAQTEDIVIGERKKITIFNIPIIWFLAITVISLFAMYTGNLPAGMVGAFLIMMVLGELFGWIGDNTPIVRSYLGGGAILSIFGAALMVHTNIMPEETAGMIEGFMQEGGFLNFYIASLITGSILGLDSKVLVKAGSRFAVPLVAAVLTAITIGGIAGFLVGSGFLYTILVIALPIMGGGMGAGGIPMSQLYSDVLGNDPGYYISMLVPAIALGNLFAIIIASILNLMGKKYPHLTGNGQLMAGLDFKQKEITYNIGQMGAGVIVGLCFFSISQMLGKVIPLHPFAIMITLIILFKISGILPKIIVDGAHQWYQFTAKNWTFTLLVGIGITFTDINAIMSALTVQYIIIVGSIVIGSTLVAAFIGKLVGFHPIEAAITAGLGMSSMGGTGDVSVLAAAKRMELMPFCQICSTLGAALILFIAGIVVNLL